MIYGYNVISGAEQSTVFIVAIGMAQRSLCGATGKRGFVRGNCEVANKMALIEMRGKNFLWLRRTGSLASDFNNHYLSYHRQFSKTPHLKDRFYANRLRA